MAIVAFLELGCGDSTRTSASFLKIRSRKTCSFGVLFVRPHIGLRFGDEGKSWRDAPELDLTEEMVSVLLRAVVHAQGQSASRVGATG